MRCWWTGGLAHPLAVQAVEAGWFFTLQGWWKVSGTILVGPEVSGQNVCHFFRGTVGPGPPTRVAKATDPHMDCSLGHSGTLSAGSLSTPAPGPWAPRMATGGQCEPGHLAGIHPEALAGQPCPEGRQPGQARGPPRWSAQDPGCPAPEGLGPGLCLGLGTSLISVITAPPHRQSRTQSAHAHPATHTLHTHRPGGLQKHQTPSWEYRGCDVSVCFSPSGRPSWAFWDRPYCLMGASPVSGPAAKPRLSGKPLVQPDCILWVLGTLCLLTARTSTTLFPARLSPPSPGLSAPATTSLPTQSHTLLPYLVQL